MTPLQLWRKQVAEQEARVLTLGTAGAVRLFLRVARARVRLVKVCTPGELGPFPTTPTAALRLVAKLDPETRMRALYRWRGRVLVVYSG